MNEIEKKKEELMNFIDDSRLSIIYHSDVDGIISAVLMINALKSFGKSVSEFIPANYGQMDNIEDKVQGKVIFLDMRIPENVYKKFINLGLCIIDHHELIEERSNFLYINPKIWGDYKYTPNSLIVYRLFENEIRDYDWLAAIGVISDAGGKENREFIEKVAKKYNIKLGSDEFLFDNKFGQAADIINSITILHPKTGAKEATELLLEIKNLDEIYRNEIFSKSYKNVNSKIKELLDKFDRLSEVHGNIYFFDLDKKYGKYSSTIATIIGLNPKYKGKIIVIGKDINEEQRRYSIRANGIEINLNSIVNEILKHINGEGGGHNKAVGLIINKIDEDRFKNEFIELIKTQQP